MIKINITITLCNETENRDNLTEKNRIIKALKFVLKKDAWISSWIFELDHLESYESIEQMILFQQKKKERKSVYYLPMIS